MTTVIENQNRQYGGMAFDSVYHQNMPHQNTPHFTDPWTAAHSSPHANPSVYATSVGTNQLAINPVKQDEVSRPAAMSMPYPSISVSAPSLVPGNSYPSAPGYDGSDVMGLPHGLPRTSFEQQTPAYPAASSISSFPATSYAPLNYSQSLHPQSQEARRMSNP